MARMTLQGLADSINEYVDEQKYFWACGLVKEVWAALVGTTEFNTLRDEAKDMVRHYAEEGGTA